MLTLHYKNLKLGLFEKPQCIRPLTQTSVSCWHCFLQPSQHPEVQSFLCCIEDLCGVTVTGKTFFSSCLLGITVMLQIRRVSKQLSSRPLSCKDDYFLNFCFE